MIYIILSSLKNAFNQNFSHSKRLLIFWCFISQRVASDHFCLAATLAVLSTPQIDNFHFPVYDNARR